MMEALDIMNWTITRSQPVILPHGKPIPPSIRGFMWAAELMELNRVAWLLKEQGVPGAVLEIGSYCGLSAAALAQPGPLVCIDTFTDAWGPSEAERYTRPEFDANMELMGLAKYDWRTFPSGKQERGAMIEPLVLECPSASALEWLRLCPPHPSRRFRLILVDAGHSYKEAHRDIMDAEPLLSPGGVMVMDDADVADVSHAVLDSPFQGVSSPVGKLLFCMRKEELRQNLQ